MESKRTTKKGQEHNKWTYSVYGHSIFNIVFLRSDENNVVGMEGFLPL
jgi:hypothetical protein